MNGSVSVQANTTGSDCAEVIPEPERALIALAEAKREPGRLIRTPAFILKYLLGVFFCQTLAGSVLVVGWTYRFARRTVIRQWWKESPLRAGGMSFTDFAFQSQRTAAFHSWPNWIVGEGAWRTIRSAASQGNLAQLRLAVRLLFPALWANLKCGVQGVLNTFVLTLPGCAIMAFFWYDGWNNSFNKGYEQAVVGPVGWIVGALLFIAAMFYVPMAQIRQAATGDWRAFYQFRLVWSIVRRRWIACLGLAALYASLSLPVTVLKTVPGFLTSIRPAFETLSPSEALPILRLYFFWAGFVFLPSYVVLRWVAARIYASALLGMVQRGAVPEEALSEPEWEVLHRLELLQVKTQRPRHPVLRVLVWAGSRAGRVTSAILLFLVWALFVFQILVSEFFHTTLPQGWINQPLVQLPWFSYLPRPEPRLLPSKPRY